MRKDNIEMKTIILNDLAKVEFTHTYAIAIKDNKRVKAAIVENAEKIMPMITVCELQAKSHGAPWGIRVNGVKENFALIKEYAREVIDICSVKEFEYIYSTQGNRGNNNRGHIFERMCAEVMGGFQADSKTAKCIDCGDIIVNGEHIQCKLWNATVTTETTIKNFHKTIMERG